MLGGKFGLTMRYSEIKSDGYIDRTGSNHRSENITDIQIRERNFKGKYPDWGRTYRNRLVGGSKRNASINRRYNPAGEYTDEAGNIKYYDNESDNYKQNHFQLIYSQKLGDYLSLHTAVHYTKGKGYYEEYAEDQKYADYGLKNIIIGDSAIPQQI